MGSSRNLYAQSLCPRRPAGRCLCVGLPDVVSGQWGMGEAAWHARPLRAVATALGPLPTRSPAPYQEGSMEHLGE